ncbi:putative lipid II flippase FtsW [Patescibacteria group bacterium]|nr:putative lipid II flippase FtsW [Patescibacteria group bacterium]MBU4347422.1 putative lipid II flippase FtsW [Patescibacteria group bacterium]
MSFKQGVNNLIKPRASQHEPDWSLIITTAVIVVFGLVMLSSASLVVAYKEYNDSYYFFKHQLLGLFAGIIAFLFFARVDYHKWKKYAFGFLIFSIVMLLLVFIPGLSAEYGKSRSWINIFGFSLQPSEFVKLSFLLYLAAWLESRHKKLEDISRGIGHFVVILGIICLLMLLQPDIGTLSIIVLTSLVVYFVGGGNIKHILAIILLSIAAVSIMAHFMPYQANRIKCFIDPSYSKDEFCYQINQSLIAVGSGGIFGRGLGASRQKYSYLPEVYNDSIFAVIGEETGLIMSAGLVLLFMFLFYRGYLISKRAPDGFGANLAIGIVSWIVIQVIINIGGMIKLMPMTGVPLPLISYGGSALLAALSALGILVNISKQTRLR